MSREVKFKAIGGHELTVTPETHFGELLSKATYSAFKGNFLSLYQWVRRPKDITKIKISPKHNKRLKNFNTGIYQIVYAELVPQPGIDYWKQHHLIFVKESKYNFFLILIVLNANENAMNTTLYSIMEQCNGDYYRAHERLILEAL